jgi:phosphate:Na+ symporter
MLPFTTYLVNFLTGFMPEKIIPRTQPKYLNDSAIEFPDTAIEAVRKETLHLFENAFGIIAHGLSLHRRDILSEKDLDEVVLETTETMPIDIDKEYDSSVKDLYSEIVNFISRAQTSMTPEQADDLFALRAAGRDIVEAIKDTKHMHKNLSQYVVSKNPHIREEYNKIRSHLGSVLRRLAVAQEGLEDPSTVLSLDIIKLEMEENDATANGMLDSLIRDGKITAQMATSLMNDSAYAYDVTKNLVRMGEVLFESTDEDMKEAGRAIMLNDEEVEEMIEREHRES